MTAFKPALIVVDLQEDFCPPNGSLAVPDGRAITPLINTLLALPFAVRVATRDWHPAQHISFAASHPGSPAPFTSSHTIVHPTTQQRYSTSLWPVHCVASTPGAQLVPELDLSLIDHVVDKGQRADREMYSAFYDPFGESDSGLAGLLRERGVSHVYVAGLALDYCVRATAEHAAREGFRTVVLADATRAVFPNKWDEVVAELKSNGVDVVLSTSPEVEKVKALSQVSR
ncbi:hypothetical protein LMH87_007409 [Akanthomyces muscarius]|uniref:nicotinamidase n=1 Tax=Akanthomyces muscarius TaxID=2231603 RepID=A0A9W8QQ81_AKAMU|nr:hypothetical protein LMH87_007409 [Akanthomyces muscarius]KAJ4165794.1 hypothetical protein LMH87_007409 [Akanthomyces muscarius]